MGNLMYYICVPLGYLMKWCWQLVGNYGVAIILFTLATKIVLIPISVWIQKNSIKMVKMQPDINFLKAKHYGNADAIAEEQTKLFKKNNYHPMVTLIPLAIQIFLLLGVIQIIYNPLNHLLAFSSVDIESIKTAFANLGGNTADSSWQLQAIRDIQEGKLLVSDDILNSINSLKLNFVGLDISRIPSQVLSVYILVPVIAGFTSWLLCFAQNASNVLQREQGKANKYGLMIFSVGLSLYLGFFVPAGIALYWIASNAFAIVQLYILNALINPKKYVDYKALEESRKALADIESLGEEDKKSETYKQNKAREKRDYKRFTSVANKHLVIYSEKSGFYKYYKDLIDELIARSNIVIHYVTNDPNDVIFEIAKEQTQIKPYYIGLKKLVTLMMMLETDMMVMTTPDLNTFYLKRSYLKKDIEYVFVPHDMISVCMTFREHSLDAFDTIFCAGPHVENEIRATERVYELPAKNLFHFGYPLADRLIEAGKKAKEQPKTSDKIEILIAPSWQEDNLLDSCIDTLLDKLYCDQYHITVRPHPEYVKRFMPRMQRVVDKYADKVGENLTFELDFSTNKSTYSSDLLITDWSGIGMEFCFATGRPAIFINTKMKVMNPNWEKVGCIPVEISLRDKIGISVNKEDVSKIDTIAKELLSSGDKYEKAIYESFDELIYNHNTSAAEGAKYILNTLANKKNKENNKK